MAPLPGVGKIGSCYDILTIDPLDLDRSAKGAFALDVDPTSMLPGREGNYLIPGYCTVTDVRSTDSERETHFVTCGYDFTHEMSAYVELSGEAPGGAEFSASASYGEALQATGSNTRLCVYASTLRINHRVTADLGSPHIKLDKRLLDAVSALPTDVDDEQVASAYDIFVGSFGTHFAAAVSLGGLAWSRMTSDATKTAITRKTEAELKLDAAMPIESLNAGFNFEAAEKSTEKIDAEKKYERTRIAVRGGLNPSLDQVEAAWLDSLEDAPAVVVASLAPITSLLTPGGFPKDPEIDAKRSLLEAAVNRHIRGRSTATDITLRYGRPALLLIRVKDRDAMAAVCPVPSPDVFNPHRLTINGSFPLGVFYPLPAGYTLDTLEASDRCDMPIAYGDTIELVTLFGTEEYVLFSTDSYSEVLLIRRSTDMGYGSSLAKPLYRDNAGQLTTPPGRLVRQCDRIGLMMATHVTLQAESDEVKITGWGPLQAGSCPAYKLHASEDDDREQNVLLYPLTMSSSELVEVGLPTPIQRFDP